MRNHPLDRPRIFRPTPPDFFPQADIVAVLDQVTNIVHFNTTFAGDRTLERRALFMEDSILRLPANYLF